VFESKGQRKEDKKKESKSLISTARSKVKICLSFVVHSVLYLFQNKLDFSSLKDGFLELVGG
jgi:hypothetical protein